MIHWKTAPSNQKNNPNIPTTFLKNIALLAKLQQQLKRNPRTKPQDFSRSGGTEGSPGYIYVFWPPKSFTSFLRFSQTEVERC